jgi:hypothetical protein
MDGQTPVTHRASSQAEPFGPDDAPPSSDRAGSYLAGVAPDQTRPGRRRAPDEIWDEVKADYLAGMSAPACCRRYGVGLTALRDRASRQGWRRQDQPWIAPNALDVDDEGVILEEQVNGDLDRVDLSQLAYVAHRRMMRAVMRGQASVALRWHRVCRILEREDNEMDRLIQQDEAVRYMLYGRPVRAPDADPNDTDGSDGSDGVSPSGQTGQADGAGPTPSGSADAKGAW